MEVLRNLDFGELKQLDKCKKKKIFKVQKNNIC